MGANCTSNRQLFEDFGVDIDPAGYAHIAYSHDAPDLGGAGSYTGYAVQVSGQKISSAASPGPSGAGSPPPSGPSTAITLPPSGCARPGPLFIRVRRPHHSRIRSVSVLVNGQRVAGRTRRTRSGLRIALSALPSGTSRVRVIVHLRRGGQRRSVSTTRTYHRCPAATRG
jgi:hypothetical protein